MKKVLIVILLVLVLAALGVGGVFVWKKYFSPKPASQTTESGVLELDPKKEATHLSKILNTPNAYWTRGLPFIWNEIEKEKGKFDWSVTDERVMGEKDGETMGEMINLAMIWPYANWDQNTCHQGEKYEATGHLKESGETLKVGKPCDMADYASFLEKVVERYDGDGENDMPNLKIPIKYWEIMNEPEMQGGSIGGAGEDLKFFVGTPQEYFEILKTSYETIKKADPGAKVAHAGMAGVQSDFSKFWTPIFEAGAGNYFDIANIHTISTDEKREDLYVIKFKKFLEKYGLSDKPIWITEVQFGQLLEKPKDLNSFEILIAKASVFGLAQGAEKLFYIENWTFWDNQEMLQPSKDEKEKKEPKKLPDLSNNSTQKVYLNLVAKINSFEKIEKIKEEFSENPGDNEGATSQVGQYKFVAGSKIVYVLWGKAGLPAEISGQVKVTDIYGESQEIEASAIELSDSPIFVEKL